MSMLPHRDLDVCPVCGQQKAGGCHACSGPPERLPPFPPNPASLGWQEMRSWVVEGQHRILLEFGTDDLARRWWTAYLASSEARDAFFVWIMNRA